MKTNPENLKKKEETEPIYPIGDKGFVRRSDVIKMYRESNVIHTIDYTEQNVTLYHLEFTTAELAMEAMGTVWEMYKEDDNG